MAVFGRPAICSPWLFEMLLLVAGVLRRLAEPIGNGPELVGLTVLPLVRKLVFGAGVMGVDPNVPGGTLAAAFHIELGALALEERCAAHHILVIIADGLCYDCTALGGINGYCALYNFYNKSRRRDGCWHERVSCR